MFLCKYCPHFFGSLIMVMYPNLQFPELQGSGGVDFYICTATKLYLKTWLFSRVEVWWGGSGGSVPAQQV
jgi:hypothetical protein